MKKVYELKILFDQNQIEQEDLLVEVLMLLGVEIQDIIISSTNDGGALSVYFLDISVAKKVSVKIKSLGVTGVKVEIVGLQKEDWYRDDVEDFKPFALTNRFMIIPGQKSSYYKGKKESIVIDSGYVFGSGRHPTTRFVSEFIQGKAHRVKTLIDVGTGTGILAIVALKCGVKNVSAIDICKDSVQSASENVKCNNLQLDSLEALDLRGWKESRQYDFVAANLITEELVPLADKLVEMTVLGGYLAVSGIPLARYSCFREKYQKYPLKCLKVSKGGGWTAILFKKK